MPAMSPANVAFIDQTIADVQRNSMNQGFTFDISGPAGDLQKAFGLANRRPAIPMEINMRGRIGSTTKSIIGQAIMREIDRGTLSLTDKLSEFIPGIPKGDIMSIENMMTMRSGVYDYQSNNSLKLSFAFNHVSGFNEPADQLKLIKANTTATVPGTTFEYTNSNYVLLAEVLRVITGRDWKDIVQNDFLTPLGMTETWIPQGTFSWDVPAPRMNGFGQHMLFPWIKDDDQTAFNANLFGAAGMLISSARDLRIWGQAMHAGYGISEASKEMQESYGYDIPWTLGEGVTVCRYGLSRFILGEWVGHDGSVPGYSAQCMYHPGTGAVIAGLENYQSADVAIWSRAFVRIARKLYPGSI